ncbi:carboxypeptidase regulatory-like domain-containing protein [Mucilaginibacter sp. X4EP1]|uniref:carboxypeptidase regulatory-like domain-containing protein n=1 Tax=Mucilaginibacter sp. X4EP1 TaxID=2723092 RepID=UPI002168879C|nr:carboxypeptidase regulatory-like domain-containing protein [Mucilaginibacter sp. X4EP1]MCS3814442.1 hypothetical protein [Mucilaginibacter sp. X4EP1]
MKYICYLLVLLMFPLISLAQFTISGRILNQADTKPVADASVFLSGATTGDNTAADGTFTLKNIKPGKYELVVSIVGFERYSQPVVVNADMKLPDLVIFPKTIALNEVKIKPRDDAEQAHDLTLFRSYFLGTSELAKQCTITNPEILDLDYDEASGILKASSADFLVIQNTALGYQIKYLLVDFLLDTKNNLISYKGFALFNEIKGTAGQTREWQKTRREVYENSTQHFLRSLLNDELGGEGFQAQKLVWYNNPERPDDALIDKKIAQFKVANNHDSLSYYTKKQKLPQAFQKLISTPLSKADLLKANVQKGVNILHCDNCTLYIAYSKSHHFRASLQVSRLNDPNNHEGTLVSFNAANYSALFDDNGSLVDPNSLSLSGAWANNRIAELLPLDYEDNKGEGSSADSTIIPALSDKLNAFMAKHLVEKAYLHLDKPAYFWGDTIWYKAYIVIGAQHQLSTLSGVLHVELIGPGDSVIRRQALQLTEGVAWGNMLLSRGLKQGDYRIRAYTSWMRNSGPEYFYDQKLQIAGLNRDTVAPQKTTAVNSDVQFFPESGYMVNGIRSKIAAKVVNTAGFGEFVKGTIEDNSGNVVADFETQHLGMGSFFITPQTGKTYRAIIKTGENSFVTELPAALASGFVLSVNNKQDSIYVTVSANSPLFKEKQHHKFYLLGQLGGKIYYTFSGRLDNEAVTTAIDKARFPSGILQLTLFSASGEPLNERVVFIQNNDALKLSLLSPIMAVKPRQNVTLTLNARDSNSPVMGTFSVSVFKEGHPYADEVNENTILTNLLLTSDLKGFIEKPNYYFMDQNDQTRADLDLLMMTQGYRRFEWKRALTGADEPLAYQPEKALELSGSLKTSSGVAIPNGKVMLSAMQDAYFADTLTDVNGNFKFRGLVLPDSTRILLSSRKANDSRNVVINIKTDYPPVPTLTQHQNRVAVSPEMEASIQKNYVEYQQQLKNDSLKNVRQLKEVSIRAQRLEMNPVLSISSNLNGPGHADQVISDKQLADCIDLSDCILAKATGIKFKNGRFYTYRSQAHINTIADASGMAEVVEAAMVVIIDGNVLDDSHIDDVSPRDIASIEILRSGANLAIYGSAASGGAFVITTKRFDNADYKNTATPGLLVYRFPGFIKERAFYSPKYTATSTDPQQPDLRNTIYWNPNLITDKNGNVNFNYYNADGAATYRVVIEGIDDNGNLGRLVYRYKVE